MAPPNWPWHGLVLSAPEDLGRSRPIDGSTPAELQLLYEQLGINSAHLYVNPAKVYEYCKNAQPACTTDGAWHATLAWLGGMLQECEELGITAIVGLKSVEVSGTDPQRGYYDPTSDAGFWEDPDLNGAPIKQLYRQTKQLALFVQRYNVAHAYDIIPEPTEKTPDGTAEQPAGWPTIQENIVQAIRQVDPDAWVVVKPGPWAAALAYQNFAPLPDPNLVYSLHMYDPQGYTKQGLPGYEDMFGAPWPGTYHGPGGRTYYDEQTVENDMQAAKNFVDQADPPYYMYVGEFSAVIYACDSNVWLQNIADIWNNQMDPPWGWSYVSQGGSPSWSPDYTYTVTPATAPAQATKLTYAVAPETPPDTARWADLEALFNGSPPPPAEGYCQSPSAPSHR
ncbi:MAG: glycoside hydrolase family 5 protein [Terriglobia bacterium]